MGRNWISTSAGEIPNTERTGWAIDGPVKSVPGTCRRFGHGDHMRGMTDEMTIGQRVAFYRRRRGLSQEVLAGLVGKTVEWLRKVENNRAELDRLSVLKDLAN